MRKQGILYFQIHVGQMKWNMKQNLGKEKLLDEENLANHLAYIHWYMFLVAGMIMYAFDEIKKVDPQIAEAIVAEQERQNSHIELIASENWVSKARICARCSRSFGCCVHHCHFPWDYRHYEFWLYYRYHFELG